MLSLAPGESQAIASASTPFRRARGHRDARMLVGRAGRVGGSRDGANGRTLVYRIRTGLKVYVMPADLPRKAKWPTSRSGSETLDRTPRTPVEVAFQNTGTKHVVAPWPSRSPTSRQHDGRRCQSFRPRMRFPARRCACAPRFRHCATGRYVVLAVMQYGSNT